MTPDTHLDTARIHLIAARAEICETLRSYPTPISGCDAQFTHLIGLRGAVVDALRALETLPFVATPCSLEPASGVESR